MKRQVQTVGPWLAGWAACLCADTRYLNRNLAADMSTWAAPRPENQDNEDDELETNAYISTRQPSRIFILDMLTGLGAVIPELSLLATGW